MSLNRLAYRFLPVVLLACSSDPPAPPPAVKAAAQPQVGAVSSKDARGAARVLWDTSHRAYPKLAPAAAARLHLAYHAAAYRVSPEALATVRAVRTVRVSSGVTVTTMRQFVDGVPVLGSDTRLLLRPDHSLVAITGGPHPAAVSGARASFFLPAEDAAVVAFADVGGQGGRARDVGDLRGGWRGFALEHPALVGVEPARVRRVLFADGDVLRPAYEVELIVAGGGAGTRGYARVVDAGDGSVLRQQNLTASEAFMYKVWADGNGVPLDGPTADDSPHASGVPDAIQPAFIAPALVTMDGFNAAPGGGSDPWLPSGAMTTTGNNVDAYTDRYAPDGFTQGMDFRADVTTSGVFDYTYNTGLSALANTTQTRGAIVQAFYTTNYMHDYWYDSGFDELAGNAQDDNFGRGGEEGDHMKVEVQDDADLEIDNANMTTPLDGASPRMQVYVWTASEDRLVHIDPANQDLLAGPAVFGPQTFNLSAQVAAALDGTAPTTDACQNLTNGPALNGRIALIDRGTCTFVDKVRAAQQKGAVGVIIVDNINSVSPPAMGGVGTGGGQPVVIPALSITKAAGDAIRLQLMSGTVTATMHRTAGPLREGSLDNTVLMHEWGHYLHHRMLWSCSNQQCDAMSEGWGDFVALHQVVKDGDDLDGVYALAAYAAGTDVNSYYHGIRRTPYTTDFTKNPLTFKYIGDGLTLPAGPPYNGGGDNSEVHNAGEIWAQMMFGAYVALQKNPGGRTFAEVKRDMADYVVAGMALTPADPTYTEQRDAILAVAAATSPTDMALMAEAFAVRGAGSCAVSPDRESVDLTGVVESFDVMATPAIGAVTVDDGVRSCDTDGILDATERGHVNVEVVNAGATALASALVTVSSATAGVTFPLGATATVGPLAPFASTVAEVVIALDPSFPDQGRVAVTATVTSTGTCSASLDESIAVPANRDEVANATADNVESLATAWTPAGEHADGVWSRLEVSPTSHLWHGADIGSSSDTQLVSPDLVVGAGTFTMSFQHRYRFESDKTTKYDGGVIEISQDGGTTWGDADSIANVPYDGTLESTNPLGARLAFTKVSAAYPSMRPVALSFGTALAGKTVKVRFRIGSDEAVGSDGWFIDNIAFGGITNTPFFTVINDQGVCAGPTANAGPDQMVGTSSMVTLDGSGSTLGGGSGTLSYQWTQTAGATVTLSSSTAVMPTFQAPLAPDVLVFQLEVSDGVSSSTDTVTITVVQGPMDAGVPDAAEADAGPDAAETPDAAEASDAAEAPDAAEAIDAATGGAVDAATGGAVDAATGGAVDAATGGAVDAATGGAVDARVVDAATADAATSTADARPADGGVAADARRFDAGVAAAGDSSGCDCSTGSGSRRPAPFAALLVLALFVWRRRASRAVRVRPGSRPGLL